MREWEKQAIWSRFVAFRRVICQKVVGEEVANWWRLGDYEVVKMLENREF